MSLPASWFQRRALPMATTELRCPDVNGRQSPNRESRLPVCGSRIRRSKRSAERRKARGQLKERIQCGPRLLLQRMPHRVFCHGPCTCSDDGTVCGFQLARNGSCNGSTTRGGRETVRTTCLKAAPSPTQPRLPAVPCGSNPDFGPTGPKTRMIHPHAEQVSP